MSPVYYDKNQLNLTLGPQFGLPGACYYVTERIKNLHKNIITKRISLGAIQITRHTFRGGVWFTTVSPNNARGEGG